MHAGIFPIMRKGEQGASPIKAPYLTGLRDVHEIAATRVKYTFAMRLHI